MAVTADQVKAMLYRLASPNLTAKEKAMLPKKAYGENFNRALALAKQVAPKVDENLWPCPITFDHTGNCEATYAEIGVYAGQILDHMPHDVPRVIKRERSAWDD